MNRLLSQRIALDFRIGDVWVRNDLNQRQWAGQGGDVLRGAPPRRAPLKREVLPDSGNNNCVKKCDALCRTVAEGALVLRLRPRADRDPGAETENLALSLASSRPVVLRAQIFAELR